MRSSRWPSNRFFQFVLVVIVAVTVLFATRSWWLRGIGYALIHEDSPVKADIAVVLAGDPGGSRIKMGGDLVREGYVPEALVSGPMGAYEERECDAAIAFAVRHGYPSTSFIPFPLTAHSTQEEATAIVPELLRRHVHRMLLVTSEYHTGRAYRTYENTLRKLGVSMEIHTVGAHDPDFHIDSWWRSREDEKIIFFEWTKTIAAVLGI